MQLTYIAVICRLTAYEWAVVSSGSGAACVLDFLSGELDVGSKVTNFYDDMADYYEP